MKWYYNLTDQETGGVTVEGPFDTEQLATSSKSVQQQRIDAASAHYTTGNPFEEADNYKQTLPRVVSKFTRKDGDTVIDQELYTDGTIKDLPSQE